MACLNRKPGNRSFSSSRGGVVADSPAVLPSLGKWDTAGPRIELFALGVAGKRREGGSLLNPRIAPLQSGVVALSCDANQLTLLFTLATLRAIRHSSALSCSFAIPTRPASYQHLDATSDGWGSLRWFSRLSAGNAAVRPFLSYLRGT